MVEIFKEVKRVLRRDGTLWCNMGDVYASQGGPIKEGGGINDILGGKSEWQDYNRSRTAPAGLKSKDLCGMPWRLAFALQADGWWLRAEIIWAKKSAMPESVTDRPSKAHEQIFLLSKSARYFYDAEGVKQPASESYANDSRWETGGTDTNYKLGYDEAMAQNPKKPHRVFNGERRSMVNLRDVWILGPEPFAECHFATFPSEIPRRAILAGTSARGCCPKCGGPWERVVEKDAFSLRPKSRPVGAARGISASDFRALGQPQQGCQCVSTTTTGWRPTCDCGETDTVPCVVLDPFAGSGTTGMVALELGRKAILIELNPEYVKIAEKRCFVTPGLQLA